MRLPQRLNSGCRRPALRGWRVLRQIGRALYPCCSSEDVVMGSVEQLAPLDRRSRSIGLSKPSRPCPEAPNPRPLLRHDPG
jgi:hypothetical protein